MASTEEDLTIGTQAMRFNKGKRRLSMVLEASKAINGVVDVLEFGAHKYNRGNWQKGMPYTEVVDSMLRHTMAFVSGEDLDPESGLPHVDHILCNALFLSEFQKSQTGNDDRLASRNGGTSCA